MSEVGALVSQLIAGGIAPEQAAEVVARAMIEGAAITAAKAPQRSAGAIRTERWRRHKASQSVTSDADVTGDASPEARKAPEPPKETQPSPKETPLRGSKKGTPRAALLETLDERHAEAVIDHRQRIRKPLTAHAAGLLAKEFAKCANPNEAADAMIARGWQGFRAAWLEDHRSQAPPRRSMSASLVELCDTPIEQIHDAYTGNVQRLPQPGDGRGNQAQPQTPFRAIPEH